MNKTERLGDGRYVTQYVDVCRNCRGVGTVDNLSCYTHSGALLTCPVCDGSGRVFIRKEISVKIEPYKSITT